MTTLTVPPPIFLVGLMGAGKTSVGKLLAAELNLPFYDTDAEVEARSGADIAWIFDVEGEAGFRERETQVLADLADIGEAVISTGGGIVTRTANRDILKTSGYVIYLYAEALRLYARVGKDKKRPLLQTADPLAKLQQLLQNRDPLYREVANLVVTSEHASSRAMANNIIRQLQVTL